MSQSSTRVEDRTDITSLPGLRDRALIGMMVTFSRVAAARLRCGSRPYFVQGRRGWGRLHEKDGKEHMMSRLNQ
jgi:integrase/recombinase XerD